MSHLINWLRSIFHDKVFNNRKVFGPRRDCHHIFFYRFLSFLKAKKFNNVLGQLFATTEGKKKARYRRDTNSFRPIVLCDVRRIWRLLTRELMSEDEGKVHKTSEAQNRVAIKKLMLLAKNHKLNIWFNSLTNGCSHHDNRFFIENLLLTRFLRFPIFSTLLFRLSSEDFQYFVILGRVYCAIIRSRHSIAFQRKNICQKKVESKMEEFLTLTSARFLFGNETGNNFNIVREGKDKNENRWKSN